MMRLIAAAALASASLLSVPAMAQTQDYFIPGQGKPAGQAKPAPARPAQAPKPTAPVQINPPAVPGPGAGQAAPQPGEAEAPQVQMQLPPTPELPPLPKGAPPPTPVVGVMGIPDVMRASSAAQQIEKVIGERREKLNADAQKEQAAWRDMQQALANDRAKLTPDQIRNRERELQERITNAQRQFRERNRIIQEAAQYAIGQIEHTLVGVIRQVAEARGMNLVLHRQQVALNVNEFDITDQVAEQLNKVLATVIIPPDGVSPVDMEKQNQAKAGAAAQPQPAAAGQAAAKANQPAQGQSGQAAAQPKP
jgi:Skp family chaperone for outer membrane proteins